MQLATNLILYIFLSLGAGYILRSFKDEEGAPKLKWYVGGLIIGAVCGVVNAVLVSGGLLFGAAFNLDTVLGPFLGGLGTGLLIGIPSQLNTGLIYLQCGAHRCLCGTNYVPNQLSQAMNRLVKPTI